MPKTYEYLGLLFYIYPRDHLPPHVHVKYAEYELMIHIESGELIQGYLPSNKRKLALKVIENNREFL